MYQIEAKAAPTALEIDKANADYQKELADYKAGLELLKNEEAMIENRKTFVRLAAVRGFGKYNYDIMWKFKDAVSLTADFEMEEVPDMVKDKSMVYLITSNGRTVVSLPKRDWGKFRFSPNADNKILAILPDNTASVFTESDFEEQKEELINADGNDFVFSLEKRDEKIESLDDLDKLIAEASFDVVEPIQKVKIYPNPARDQATLSFESELSMEFPIQIFDVNGRVVARQNTLTQVGENQVNLDVANLTNGNYMVRMTGKDFNSTEQLVIVKN